MEIIATPILGNLGLALVHSIWQGFLAAIAVIVFRKLTKGQSPTLQYGFQIIMLFACFTAFLITFGLFQFTGSSATELTFMRGAETASGQNLATQSAFNGTSLSLYSLQNWLSNNAYMFGLLWCIGFVVLAARYLINFSLTQQLRRTGLSSVPVKWEHRFKTLVLNAGLTRPIGIYISSKVNNPLTLGFFKPVVLVPASFFTGLPSAQIEAVLLHEIAHIRRHDYLINLAQTAIKTVFFFHPAIHFISRKIDEDREHACDDFSVNYTRDPHSLAKALAALRLSHSGQAFAMAADGKNAPFITRLKRLTVSPETTKSQGNLMVPALTVIMAGLIYFSATPMTDAHPTTETDAYEHPDSRKSNYSFETVVKDGKSITVKVGEDGRRWVRTENGWLDLDNDSDSIQMLKGKLVAPPTPPTPPNFGKYSKWDQKNFEKQMAQFELDMQYFEADMKRFGKEMTENYAVNVDEDKIIRQVERAMERAGIELELAMDRAEQETERAIERAEQEAERAVERAEEQRERAAERALRAEERAERAKERAERNHERAEKHKTRHEAFKNELIPMLLTDGLISSPDQKIKITYPGNRLTVNGKKATGDKYCELWEKYDIRKSEQSYIKITPKSYEVQFKSKDGKSTHHETYGEFTTGDKKHKDKSWQEGNLQPNFIMPTSETWTSSAYGKSNITQTKFHRGMDFAGKPNSYIVASAPGKVIKAEADGDWGKVVEIEHADGYKTVYAHMNGVCVKPNDIVYAGQQVGLLGSTGKSTGPHLHFEIHKDGKTLNPENLIVGS